MGFELLIILCIAEFLSGTFLIARLLLKLDKLAKRHEELQTVTEKWQANWKNERQRLESDIDSKKSEISSLSLHYIHKFEHMNELRLNLESLKNSIPGSMAPKFEKVVECIEAIEPVDKEWEYFRRYFNDVNDGFLDHLKSNYPTLSTRDLKLCSLMRMNLETRQIATIMGVSPESTKVTRHRIRKKLGLTGSDSLHQFLQNIATLN